ncbi:TIGR03545 family protein [Aeoliella mucimassa]|uniref:TIGR03545 family protein n=1 Tax=Aeoliella mucimassa TaxID=2527972 RepID=A0A518AU04_9BACT|nr:TIGR03545 family protein [Aeoliella mucimassa]QDU58203.1 hypothetical protein Pan181_44360 [Aeoliella mucimassa]
MRFLRFSYIIPRVIFLIALLLLTEVGSGYLLRWGIVSTGESSIGAKVDVESVKASLLDTRVLMQNIAIANPKSPMRNLVEADRVEIDLNTNALLRKKVIADYAVISGLAFDTERTTSGELPATPEELEQQAAESWLAPMAKEAGGAWLTQLESRLTTDLEQQFESVRLAEELGQRWPQKYKDLEAKAKSIKADAKQLEQDVRTAKQNPLRHVDFLAQVPQRLKAMEQSIRQLKNEIALLPDQLAKDREAVAAAREHDEQLIRQQLKLDEIDSQQLTEYLLGNSISDPLYQTIAWVKWARTMVPPRGHKTVESTATRGEDVLFAGVEHLPNVLLKAARIDGTARISGQPVELVGMVRDWTNQPELHTKPTTVEFKTKGGLPLSVVATFDRTDEVPRDEVVCSTSDLLLPAQAFGKTGKLQLALEPSRANISLAFHLEGDNLDGQVEIVQTGLQLTPTIAVGRLSDQLQSSLASNLSGVNSATTTVSLTGTLDDPSAKLDSTLGTALASAFKKSATDLVAGERDRLVAQARQKTDAQMAKINGQFAEFQAKVTSELDGPRQIVNNLLGTGSDTQVGRSPFGQLFK